MTPDEETLTSELNEIGTDVVTLASRIRVASKMSNENLIVTRTEVDLAIQLCIKLERWLKDLKERNLE